MKKLSYFIFILLAGSMAFNSCKKNKSQHQVNPEISEGLNLKKGKVILVEPMGPAYDTENLLDAFAKAKEMGPGATVELASGEFYLDYMVIESFYGTFKGAGIDKTIVHTVPEGITLPVTSPVFDTKPYLLSFAGGDVEICHLTFDIINEKPVEPFKLLHDEEVTFLATVLRIAKESETINKANSYIHHVSFKGKYVDFYDFTPYNVDNCILYNGDMPVKEFEGNHTVENCYFETCETAINAIGSANGNIRIGGSPAKTNVITNSNLGVLIMDSKNLNLHISHNEMKDMQSAGGIYLMQGVGSPVWTDLNPAASNYHVKNNIIHLVGDPGPEGGYWPDGIYMVDLPCRENYADRTNFHIHKNTFTLTGGIQNAINSYSTFDVKVIKNVIKGDSRFAIGLWGNDSDWKMIFNDFKNYEHEWTDIALGQNTHDNKVICETEHTSVADLSGENIVKGPAKRGKKMIPKHYQNSRKPNPFLPANIH
jgi:hypothetical protein